MVTLVIPGQPCGKQRARVLRIGRSFTPQKTVQYETLIREVFAVTYPGASQLDGALRLELRAYYQIPQSASKKKVTAMLAGEIRPTVKPDFDNVCKIVGDALNGIAYQDDKQIVEQTFSKWYSDAPRIEITISTLI
jgi:Holliday junction resolvase RusA-like endonuclease